MAKTRFSMGEALGEGFRLASQRPLSVFVWGLLMLIPTFVPLAIVAPAMMDMPWAELAAEEGMAESAVFSDYLARSNLANLLSYLLQIVTWGLVGAAVYRLVLDQKRGRGLPFGLAFAMDELRIMVSFLAIFVGAMVFTVVVILLMVGIGLAVWPTLTDAGQAWAVAAMVFVSLAVLLAAYARVCLIPPACVAGGEFQFGEGWRLGKGQTGRLALMTIVIWLISMLIMLLAYAVIAIIGFGIWMGLGLSAAWPEDPASLADILPLDPRLGWLGILILPFTWAYGLVAVVGLAPYASAVRQLTPQTGTSEPTPPTPNEL